MNIKKAIFVCSSMFDNFPINKLTEIGISGRSNVGKSSFINAISNNNKLARTSKTPGKTITLNFYLINDQFYLVDMPGYGFASRNNKMNNTFSDATNKYIETRNELKGFIMLVDSRVTTEDDIMMKDYLKSKNIPYVVILTKIDKLKRNDIIKRVNYNKELLETENICGYSSLTHENENTVLDLISKLI